MFNVMLLTLFILWLLSCGLSAAAGYFVGGRGKAPRAVKPLQPDAEETPGERRAKLEESNFLTYDGTPQPPIE